MHTSGFCKTAEQKCLGEIGGGGGSRTRVRKCYWSRDYMLIRVHALGTRRFRLALDVRGRRSQENTSNSFFCAVFY
jgi:hypothetical protein